MADKDSGSFAARPMGPPKTTSSFDADDVRAMQDNRSTMHKLDRTMSDIYQDELYNPIVPLPTRPVANPVSRNPKSQKEDSLSQLLQAANVGHLEARSQTSRQENIRTRSPFSPWASERFPSNDGSSKNHLKRPGLALSHGNVVLNAATTPQATVSPKEVALNNINLGENHSSLFPDSPSSQTNHDTTEATSVSSDESTSDTTQTDPHQRQVHKQTTQSSHTAQKHLVKAGDNQSWLNNVHNVSGDQKHSAPSALSSQASDNLPDFPAHLTSMDTTRSDSLANSSQDTQETTPEVQSNPKPRANGGTYTCTYSGCTKRFETGARLQKHKREDHRQVVRPLDHESDQETASERNNQSGPHRCDRINPSTGKPCNSVFSRPYDLTRHEDTIHNARKQKVRCQLCTEEKTFSRNDALTRHMRVVHPNVDFSAKNKKRQGS